MSAALELAESTSNFERVVESGFDEARQGAVIVVEARGVHPRKQRWLGQLLANLVPGSAVHPAGDSLFVILVRHAGPAESWLLLERARKQLRDAHWDRVSMASACWPMQGSSPMDVVAAALASLLDDRARVDEETDRSEGFLDLDGGVLRWCSAGELLGG